MNASHPIVRTRRPGDSALAGRLRRAIEGDVLFDAPSRGRYSTDASIYQIEPLGVVVPRTDADVAAVLEIAREQGVPVLILHGDTHTYRFDQPFWLQGESLRNVWRLEVPGESDVRAVHVEVDVSRPQPFSVRAIAAP